MPNLALEGQLDSRKFKEGYIDNTIRSNTDGGYKKTRPRHTRGQLRTFVVGWTTLDAADWTTLQSFYDTYETHSSFDFTHPVTAVVYTVRFAQPIDPRWKGIGATAIYDVTAQLEEV